MSYAPCWRRPVANSDSSGYTLQGFQEWMEIWEKNEPSSAVSTSRRIAVLEWMVSRGADPYAGARREHGAPNQWLAKIPGTLHDGHMVVCTFYIYEATKTVRCDMLTTLGLPI